MKKKKLINKKNKKHRIYLHKQILLIRNNLSHLALALPWASRSTVGTPSRTSRVNKDCSILEYFWKAMFLITGGNWWWSPIMIQRFKRFRPSSGFCKRTRKSLCLKLQDHMKPSGDHAYTETRSKFKGTNIWT